MDKISALMDGELAREDAVRLVTDIRERGALREAWATYHLIGAALRGEPCADCGVMRSVSIRLTEEPTVLAPRRMSNETKRRWALPSLAAAAAVASVTWMALETQQGGVGQLVASPASHVVVPAMGGVSNIGTAVPFSEYPRVVHFSDEAPSTVPIQFSEREFDAYLLAHQEFSPSNTLQGLAPYVRTVTSGALETRR